MSKMSHTSCVTFLCYDFSLKQSDMSKMSHTSCVTFLCYDFSLKQSDMSKMIHTSSYHPHSETGFRPFRLTVLKKHIMIKRAPKNRVFDPQPGGELSHGVQWGIQG